MYIAPNSTIRILHGIRWNPDYKDTVYWNDENTKETYFISKTKYTLTEQSYQRAGSGVIRVQLPIDNLYDCNYIMFRNTSYENKWFYAFILGLTYVNNITTEITYAIDDMTTWFNNVDMNPCFVEREHVNSDAIGEHLEPEPISISNMTYRVPLHTDIMNNDYSVILAVADNNQISFSGFNIARGHVSGLYTGVLFISIDITSAGGITQLNTLLDDIVNNNLTDSVVGLFMYPNSMFDTGVTPHREFYTVPRTYMYQSLDGYVPKNNKLFTYPFNFMEFSDDNGHSYDLRCELFNDSENGFQFEIRGILSCEPKIICFPNNYLNNLNQIAYKITMSDFPQCAFAVDSYKAWVANRGKEFLDLEREQIKTNWIGTGVNYFSSIPSSVSGGGANALLGTASSIANLAVQGQRTLLDYERTNIQFEQAYYAPDRVKGSNAGDALAVTRLADFYFKQCCLTAEEAQRADDFLSMYGYAVNRVKIPNINVRQNWNFVKTRNSKVTSKDVNGCPADVVANINKIFNDGVTFWMNPANVGRYDLTNNIL